MQTFTQHTKNTQHGNLARHLTPLSSAEQVCLAACAIYIAIVLMNPALPAFLQGMAHVHAFADQRAFMGIPNALDVLSNLPFILFGALGLYLQKHYKQTLKLYTPFNVLCLGFCATGVGSMIYHVYPHAALGLAFDRGGMAIAFAGMLSLAVHGQISQRAAQILVFVVLLAGAHAVAVWYAYQQFLPWVVLQVMGMLALASITVSSMCAPKTHAYPFGIWCAVMGLYVAAKLAESHDLAVWSATAGMVSGHTLKHIIASLAILPVLWHSAKQMRLNHTACL